MHILIGWSGGACVSLEWREVNGAIDVSTMRLDLICILTLLRSVGQMSRRLIGIRQLNVRVGGGFFWGGPSWSPIEGSIKHPQLKCIIHIYFQLAIRLKKKHFKFGFETERESASHQHRDPIMDPSYYGIQNPLQKLLFIFPCKTRKKIEQRLLNGNEKKRKEKTAEKNGRRTEPPESTEENGGRRGVQAACGGNENWKEHTHTTEKKTQKMMCNIPPSSPVIAW